MARYTGPVEKLERRLGVSLALKGERRLAGKSAFEKDLMHQDNMDKEEQK